MTIWVPDLSRRSGPRYRAIADAIADSLAKGELAPGERLPPQRDLAFKLGVTLGTVTRGYMLAQSRGLISGEVGRGSFVRGPSPASDNVLGATDPDIDDLTRNSPTSPDYDAAMRATLLDLAGRSGIDRLLHYMPANGHVRHRAAGATWIARTGLTVSPEQIVVTGGAQQGLAAALGALVEPGGALLCEELTYCGLMDAAGLFRLRLEAVAMDEQGMLPDALAQAARDTGAKLVVVQPTIQNPTTATMGEARRRDIAAVARAHDLIVLEDDIYGFLPAARPTPIATLIPERTVYLASVSKCLAPGLRVAWLAAPPVLFERLSDAVHAMSIALPALPAEIVHRWIVDGTAERLTQGLRAETAARQRLAGEIFHGFALRGDPASLHIFLHLPAPWRREEFVAAARAQGILVVPASTFAVGRGSTPHAVRISLSPVGDRARLRHVLIRLRDLAAIAPSARRAVI